MKNGVISQGSKFDQGAVRVKEMHMIMFTNFIICCSY